MGQADIDQVAVAGGPARRAIPAPGSQGPRLVPGLSLVSPRRSGPGGVSRLAAAELQALRASANLGVSHQSPRNVRFRANPTLSRNRRTTESDHRVGVLGDEQPQRRSAWFWCASKITRKQKFFTHCFQPYFSLPRAIRYSARLHRQPNFVLIINNRTPKGEKMSKSIRFVHRGVKGSVRQNFNWDAIRSHASVVHITAAQIIPLDPNIPPLFREAGEPSQNFRYHLGDAKVWVSNVSPHFNDHFKDEVGGVEFILNVEAPGGIPGLTFSGIDVAITITVEDNFPVQVIE